MEASYHNLYFASITQTIANKRKENNHNYYICVVDKGRNAMEKQPPLPVGD